MSITPMASAARLVALSSRRRKSQPGSTGSAARRSTKAKPTSSAAATPSRITLGADHQRQDTPPWSRPRMSRELPAVSRPAPARSSWGRVRSTCSWNLRIRAQAATAPNGTLTKKIQRQSAKSTKSPPSVGPTTEDVAQTLAT